MRGAFTAGRTTPLFFVAYLLPGAAVIARWPAWVVRPDEVAPMLGVGLGGYALLFALLVFGVPRALEALGHPATARRWRNAAFRASMSSSIVVVELTVMRVPTGPIGVRVMVGVVACLAVLAALLQARSRVRAD